MDAHEEYLVPAAYGEATLVEKKSRFIARIWPVADEAGALSHIDATRRANPDANHNVYAYIIRGGAVRFSDDGEPGGTSGMPTLKVLQGRGLNNVLCVVTRYFGGVLLGAGGLVRAYSGAARLAADAAGVTTMRLWRVLLVPSPYPLLERVRGCIDAHGGVVRDADFGTDVLLEAMLPEQNADRFLTALADLSAGTVEAETVEQVFRGG